MGHPWAAAPRLGAMSPSFGAAHPRWVGRLQNVKGRGLPDHVAGTPARRLASQRRFPQGSFFFLAASSPRVRLIVSLYAFSISAASFFFCSSAFFASPLLPSSSP